MSILSLAVHNCRPASDRSLWWAGRGQIVERSKSYDQVVPSMAHADPTSRYADGRLDNICQFVKSPENYGCWSMGNGELTKWPDICDASWKRGISNVYLAFDIVPYGQTVTFNAKANYKTSSIWLKSRHDTCDEKFLMLQSKHFLSVQNRQFKNYESSSFSEWNFLCFFQCHLSQIFQFRLNIFNTSWIHQLVFVQLDSRIEQNFPKTLCSCKLTDAI